MSRYLTKEEKVTTVADWLSYRETSDTYGTGVGDPDREVFALTDALNAIEGVCTLQSCSGHRHAGETEDTVNMWSGQLWLKLSEPMAAAFYMQVYALIGVLSPQLHERVQTIYHESEGEVVDIIFQGLNAGPEALNLSSTFIVSFFAKLSKEVHA